MDLQHVPYNPTIQRLGEDCTIISLEFRGKRNLFSVTGTELPYEVSYLHQYGLRGGERKAWFEEHAYPLLVKLHELRMAEDAELAAIEGAVPAR